MVIGGFQKNSMIDFPGKISSVVFTGGCNFKCPYCHNPSLVDGTFEAIPESSVFEYLKKRKGLIEGVVITGGEPTLHKDLPFFCSRIKDMGFGVKLDTNGSKPEILKKIIDTKSVDYIAMDVKAPLDNYFPLICEDKGIAAKIQFAIDAVIDSGIDYEFRVTCTEPFAWENNFTEILKSVEGAKRLFLQKLVRKNMLDENFEGDKDPDLEQMKTLAESYVLKCKIR